MMKQGILLLAVLFLGACASTGAGGVRTDRSLLTYEEVHDHAYSNALQLVQAERPHWLRIRGPQSIRAGGNESVMVYLDTARLGGPSTLSSVPLASIQYLRFYDAAEANLRYGTGHEHGVILVSTTPAD